MVSLKYLFRAKSLELSLLLYQNKSNYTDLYKKTRKEIQRIDNFSSMKKDDILIIDSMKD